jgi:hypothetical protein
MVAMTMPQGMFGLRQPEAPFVWGQGGQRMTPEEAAMQRRLAEQQMAAGADYSPVGHWTQGLARTSQGILGALQAKKADKAMEANRSADAELMQALLSGPQEGQPDPVLAALTSPYASDRVREVAGMEYQRRNPKPAAPTEFEKLLGARGIERGSNEWNTALDRYISGKSDPQVTVTLPGGGIFVGPQSELANVLKGGGQASPGPQPGMVEDGYRFKGGDPADQSNWERVMDDREGGQALSAAARSRSISREEADRVRQSLGPNGQAAFERWMRENNITIGGR